MRSLQTPAPCRAAVLNDSHNSEILLQIRHRAQAPTNLKSIAMRFAVVITESEDRMWISVSSWAPSSPACEPSLKSLLITLKPHHSGLRMPTRDVWCVCMYKGSHPKPIYILGEWGWFFPRALPTEICMLGISHPSGFYSSLSLATSKLRGIALTTYPYTFGKATDFILFATDNHT